jgi:phosphoribosylamine-glycine ligase
MSKKNIVIMNRWADDYADYCKYINHYENNVFYVTDDNGSKYLQGKENVPHEIYKVDSLKNEKAIKEIITDLRKSYGNINHLVALSESDLLVAAKIRESLDINGMNLNTSLNFLDKVTMKSTLKQADVQCPRYSDDLTNIDDFVGEVGFPIVLKPCQGASSRGVMIIKNYEELKKAKEYIINEPYEYEEFIEGPIIHVDGIVQKGEIIFQKSSRYINTCYDYAQGKPLGSIIINDQPQIEVIEMFTKKVITALGLNDGVFHLEAIIREGTPVFLEVGARQGGGEIVPLIKDLYSVDIIEAFIKTQVGELITINMKENHEVGGFLLIPEPPNTPCLVKSTSDMTDCTVTLRKQVLPEVGSVLGGNGGYYFNGGRFIFRGDSQDIEKDIYKVIESYELVTEVV